VPLAPAAVSPGVDYEEDKNQKTKDRQEHGAGLGLPQLLEASGNILKIHAGKITPAGSETKPTLDRV
jgi:hypothetical protein